MHRSERIQTILTHTFNPQLLQIENESHRHQVPKESETHFKVMMVSDCFHNLNRIARHRLIHSALKEELATGLHALTLSLFTPEEWEKHSGDLPKSPPCHHSS